jgi:hypothetical protein
LWTEKEAKSVTVIDLTRVEAVVEVNGKVRCKNCVTGRDYWKGCDPEKEILLTCDDIENHDKLYVCDYCEEEL